MPEREHPHYVDEDIINVETHHEKSDVNVKALLWATAIFVVFGFITHFVLWGMYKAFVKIERKPVEEVRMTEVARPADASVPKSQPLLQPFPTGEEPPYRVTPVTDMQSMRAAEEKALTTYGWVDQQKGIVRIPIDQAKQIALQRGFPVQSSSPPAATTEAPR
jgi:hypothetical protein